MTPEEKQRITDLVKVGRLSRDEFIDFINAMPEESECWACKNSGVVYADYMPQNCPVCAMPEESYKRKIEFDWLCGNCGKKICTKPMETQIAKRKIEEWLEDWHVETRDKRTLGNFLDWLDNREEE